MATISLRAYYREIESLIERGRTRDAVAHCRQILKFYPKSIDTYRLLGKAYLESQRFGEAADVLQRVLSAIPDDFISQIGMSIIREDEGNLDAALWHMERAFEAQPSNVAVQDELRRLYGRRDGMQPAKIRLTRGALVRMYARGDLQQQAIAEARMALVEQPDRVDIELILAKMFFLSNQKVSATEVCTRLLEILPFCFEANKMLIDLLPGTPREEEISTYQQRTIALDPYLAHAPQGASSSLDAPEESIMVESLELTDEGGEHPEWGGGEEEQLPDWLAALETRERPPDELTNLFDKAPQESITTQTAAEDAAEMVTNEDDQIPSWMKAAGWQPAESEEEIPPTNFDEVAEELTSEGEVPEWLQSIAPAEEPSGILESEDSTESEENNQWLESILAGTAEDTGQLEGLDEEPSAEKSPFEGTDESEFGGLAGDEIPKADVFDEEKPGGEVELQPEDLESVAEILNSAEEGETIPDWLAGMASIDTEPVEEEAVEGFASDSDWLKSLSQDEEKPITEELSEVVEEEVEEAFGEPLTIDELEPVLPDLDLEGAGAPLAESTPEERLTSEEFLSEIEKAIPLDQGATQPTRIQPPFEGEPTPLETAFAEPDEILPDITEIRGQEPEAIEEAAAEEIDLADIGLGDLLPENLEEEKLAAASDLEIPEWLKETLDKDFPEVERGIVKEEGAFERILEDELRAEPLPEQLEEEDISWLKKLSEQSEEVEDISGVAVEETLEEPLEEFAAEEVEELPVDVVEPDMTTEKAVLAEEEQPEWTKPEEVEPAVEEAVISAEEEEIKLPDWLKEDLAEPEGEAEEVGAEAVEVSNLEDEFEWVKEEGIDFAAETSIPEEAETTLEAAEELHETVETKADLGIEFAEPEVEKEELEETALIEGMDFDLTEEMAEEAEAVVKESPIPEAVEAEIEEVEGAAEEFPTPETVEEEIEEVPDWLMALAEDTESELEPAPASEEAVPDWLKEIEVEEFAETMPAPIVDETVEPAVEGTMEEQPWMSKAEEISTAPDIEDTSPIKVTPSVSETAVPSEGTTLYNAQVAMTDHDVETALAHYNQLISQGESLEDIIHDLREALDHYPVDISIWQSLGDAYMHSNQLQDALDAYTKAEELLR